MFGDEYFLGTRHDHFVVCAARRDNKIDYALPYFHCVMFRKCIHDDKV